MIGTYGDNGPVTPDQVRHGLDDKQAYLWVGMYRMAVSTSASDDELHADLILADKIAASASFLAADIRGLLDKRAAERRDAENEAHEQHAEPGPGGTVITLQRACNGCGRSLRDVSDFEMDAAVAGDPLPDVRHECPDCRAAEPFDVLVAGDALADDLVEMECPRCEAEQPHRAHAWGADDQAFWCHGLMPTPDVLMTSCDRVPGEVPHDSHFWGEGLRCPGYHPEAGEDR